MVSRYLPAKVRQRLNQILIETGLRNPGALDRHNWVGPGYHEMKRAFQIKFLKSRGLSPDKTLLDLGCGTLRGGIPIIDYLAVGHYFGIDVRARVILEAHQELAKHNLGHKNPTIISVKDAYIQIATAFDIIWSFQVFQHLSKVRLDEAIKFATDHLKPEAVIYATALIGEYSEGEWQGFPVITRPLDFYICMTREYRLQCQSLGSLDSLGYGRQAGKPSHDVMLEFKSDLPEYPKGVFP